ncbi:uncharacterized protein BO72DRAFT_487315 [Aspergillus fijiensis CBS 313.89]|uniref:C2H2-type domain-containing protein n=1 Tax=Aspergillus fijiensis CBS 313.89 TaxID=1448319 RepID=A0A8G1RMW3_9EURO|nr:uncharacterized protein BO72DRAFT_487315 [Aspergillus fijiensis CBS 313.89]RAK75583.1 hypothetical protein BO72DRAFT_487315 [Aspergillus fijiensis CBS 313.89]
MCSTMSRFTTIKSLYDQAQICDAMLQELVSHRVQRTLSFADVHNAFRRFVKESRFLTSKKASVRYQAKHQTTMDLFTYLFRLIRVNLLVLLVRKAPRVTFLENVYNFINKMRVHLLTSDARSKKGHGGKSKHRFRKHEEDPSMFSVLDADNNDVTSRFKDFVFRIIKQMFPCVDSKLHARIGTRLVDSRIAIGYHQHKHRGRSRGSSSKRKTVRERKQPLRDMPDVFAWPPMPRRKDGEPEFRCPYCMVYFPVGDFDEVRWEYHVLQDVRPYLCLWGSCSSVFGSMKAWIKHMDDHRRASAGGQAHPLEQCPFCGLRDEDHGSGGHGNEGLLRHIAGHLDYLALLALPGPMDTLLEMHLQGRRIGIEQYEHADDARGRQRSRSNLAALASAIGDVSSRSPSPLRNRDRDSMMVELDRSSVGGGDPEGNPEGEHHGEQEPGAEYEENPFRDSAEDESSDEEPENHRDLHSDEEDHADNEEEEHHDDQPEEEVVDAPEDIPLEAQEERPQSPEEVLEDQPDADPDPSEINPEADQEEESEGSDAEEQDRASNPDDDDDDPEAGPQGTLDDSRRKNRGSKIPKLKKSPSPEDETRGRRSGSRMPQRVSFPVQTGPYKSLFN